MNAPQRNAATTQDQILIDWASQAAPENGDSEIISYHLQWLYNGAWRDLYGQMPGQTGTSFTVTTNVERGVTYEFRLRSENIFGFSENSEITQIKAAGIPYAVLSPVVTSIEANGNVLISWASPDDNSEDLTHFEVEVENSDGSSSLPNLDYCPGDALTRQCSIPVPVLTASPYNLAFQQLVRAKVRPVNFYGIGPWNEFNTVGAKIRQVPSQMGPISLIRKSETMIEVAWQELTGVHTGDSVITAYTLYWDNNSGTPDIMLVSDASVTSFTVYGTIGGFEYQFKVSASNIYGEGEASEILTQLASDLPEQIGLVQTRIEGTTVIFEWTAPFDNYQPILEYDFILLTQLPETYVHEETLCPGSDPSITRCDIEMQRVIEITGLQRGELIQARVKARNENGWEAYSQQNVEGARIETEPDAPPSLSWLTYESKNDHIDLEWELIFLLNNGGSEVLGYELYVQHGADLTIFTFDPDVVEYSVTGLIGGETYVFSLAGFNKYGVGVTTDTLTVIAAQEPDPVVSVSVVIQGSYALITWDQPFQNYAAITGYYVYIQSNFENSAQEFEFASDFCSEVSSIPADALAQKNVKGTQCSIELADLQTEYSVNYGDQIIAGIVAINPRGWSTMTANTVGPLMEDIPRKMLPIQQGPLNSNTVLDIAWEEPDNAGSPIISYIIKVKFDYETEYQELLSNFNQLSYQITTNVVEGAKYMFIAKAVNKWGPGIEWSEPTTVLAATLPQKVSGLSSDIDLATGGVLLQWAMPHHNGAAVTEFKVQVRDSNGDWQIMSLCSGSELSCLIPMDELWTLGLIFNDFVEMQVSAINLIGQGPWSDSIAETQVRREPSQMAPVTRGSLTNEIQIQAEWVALTSYEERGGSDILAYQLWWDENTGNVNILASENLELSHTILGLESHIDFQLKVRARNIYGWSEFSEITTIRTTDVPDTAATVLTLIVETTFIISWEQPGTSGEPILEYHVQILTLADTFVEDPNCSGDIYEGSSCVFSHAYLIETYNFPTGHIVKARVRARNQNGWGAFSQVNTGNAWIMQEPVQMAAPQEGAATTIDRVQLDWQALTTFEQTGGTNSILSYNLEISYLEGVWLEVVGESTPFLLTTYTEENLVEGTDYKFRLRAKNKFGWGAWSSTVTIRADEVPAQISPVTTTAESIYIRVSWALPSTVNGSPIEEYRLLVLSSDGLREEETTSCDGTDVDLVVSSTPSCLIPMQELEDSYGYAQGALIRARIQSRNLDGWAPLSEPNTAGAVLEVEPHQINQPRSVLEKTSQMQVSVEWDALPSLYLMGGVAVTSYHLQWDKATAGAEWFDIIGLSPSSMALTTDISSEVQGGLTYHLRVRARNVHGWGPWSPTAQIKAAQIPDIMDPVVTGIDPATGGVQITWSKPHDGYQELESYFVEIKANDGSWIEQVEYCGGEDSTQTSCLVPMPVLQNAPYNLPYQTLIEVRATAYNSYGFALRPSDINSAGAVMRRVPDQMAPPSEVSSTENTIVVQWQSLSGLEAGDSDILSYNLYWDNASGALDIELIDAIANTFTVTGLVGGNNYSFKVRARNIYGYGAFSDVFLLQAADIPGKPGLPVVGLDATSVKVMWVAPYAHEDPIDAYQILFQKADGSFVEDLSRCDGSDPSIVLQEFCLVPMLEIRPLTGLAVDQIIKAKVRAHNSNGWGAFSELNIEGQVAEALPIQIEPLSISFADVTNTQVTMRWNDPEQSEVTGGINVPLLSYIISYQFDVQPFQTLTTVAFGSNEYTHSGLVAGINYNYRIKAVNKYGQSLSFSETTTIQTGQAPEKPLTPTTAVSDVYVRIEWQKPFNNHLQITAYKVLLKQESGDFVESDSCDGSSATALEFLFCTIPMSEFWTDPYNFPVQTLIEAKVQAINERGSSLLSDANAAGALVQVPPSVMTAPERGSDTNAFQVQVIWTVPYNGDAPILTYELLVNRGSQWEAIAGSMALGNYLGTEFTMTDNVIAGHVYKFKIRAKNKWGWADYSSPDLEVMAADVPYQV